MKNNISIFISYSWNDTAFVDVLDNNLQGYGYKIERDIRDAGYAKSIKEFMIWLYITCFLLKYLMEAEKFVKMDILGGMW